MSIDRDPMEKLHTACSSGTPREVLYLTKSYPGIVNGVIYNEDSGGNVAALHLAVERGHKEIVKLLLENGAKPDILDSEGYSPLQIACTNGNLAIAELLLSCGANPENLVEHLGSTSLHEAVISGSLDVVKLLYQKIRNKGLINHQDNKGWAPLHYACQNGHSAIARFLLREGAKVDIQIVSGRSALHLAAFEGHVECARLLLEHNCKVNIQDDEGWAAVVLASQEGHPEIVKLICQKSPDLSLTSKLGRNALHSACFNGHIEVVKHILNAGGSSLCNDQDIDGWTPLHLAAQEGFKDIVHLLLTNLMCSNVSIDAQAKNGRTPIHNAILKGREEVVVYLLKAGANVEIKDTKGWTPLHVACQHGHSKIAKLLVHHGAGIDDTIDSGRNSLHLAAFEGYFEIAELLVDKGINCSLQDRDRWTPLHLCVQEDHENIVQLLMRVPSIDVNVKAHNKRIPLHSACFHGRLGIAKMLLGKGSHIEVQDESGWTPLHLCAQEGHLDIVSEILQRKPNVNIQADNLRQPIHLACMKGHTDIVKCLIEAEADIHSGDSQSWTPLCVACHHNSLRIVELLIDNGAQLNIQISGGRNPIHLAAFNGFQDICQILKEKGAELSHQDSEGWSALHLAAQEGFLDIVQLLVEGGADITASSRGGRQPLHMCASSGHTNIVNYLLDQALVDVNCTDSKNWTPFHSAANRGHVDATESLLSKGADFSKLISMGRNALHLCAFNGHTDIARLLLGIQIDFQVQDKDGWTSLHLAAQEGHLEIVQMLLDKGANASLRAENGRVPLHLAAMHGHADIVNLLLTHTPGVDTLDSSKWTPLHSACNKGHLAAVQALLERGASVKLVINSGRNCLHLAGFNGARDVCKLLLKHGCRLNVKDKDGWTPLHLAGQEGHIDTVVLFLEQGANIEQLSNDGRTPLQLSCLKGHSSVVQKLIKYGARCDVADAYNWTPLIDASAGGFLELVDLLVENGAKLDTQIDNGQETALHYALANKHLQVALYLVLSGAKCDLPDKQGKTALQIAEKNGYRDLVEEMNFKRPRAQTREEKVLKVKVPPILKFKKAMQIEVLEEESRPENEMGDQGNTAGVIDMQVKESTEESGQEVFHSGVSGIYSINDEEVKSVQKLINERYQDKPRAKGIIFIVGITGAAGTDVDVENMSKTFRDDLEFATYREENMACSRLACVVKAAASFDYPMNCTYIAFYFAGHGGIDEHQRPFLMPTQEHSSGNEKLLIHDNILNQFKSSFAKSRRRKKLIFFFDCCLSSSGKSGNQQTIFALKSPVSCLLAYATSLQQKSIGTSRKGGAWTNRLCGRLTEKVSLSDILEEVNEDLRNEGFEQVPHYESSVGQIYLNGKAAASIGYQNTLKLHRQQLHEAIGSNANTLVAVVGGLCYGNVINSKFKDDVIRAKTNDGVTVLLDYLEVIVNEKPPVVSRIFEVMEHEQTLSSIVKAMKEEEERKRKAAYEVAGIHDVLEEYKKLEHKMVTEKDQLKKGLSEVMEKLSVIEREHRLEQSLKQQVEHLNTQLQVIERRDEEREERVAAVQEKYRREMDKLTTEYKMKLHQLEEVMQKEFTEIFTDLNVKFK